MMKVRKETNVNNAFTIDTILSVHYARMKETEMPKQQEVPQNGEGFDFWQLLYLESGRYVCSIGGRLLEQKPGQILLVEPQQVRCTWQAQNVLVKIINFGCNSAKMAEIQNACFQLSDSEKDLLLRAIETGLQRFENIAYDNPVFWGQQPEQNTTDCELQTIKNCLELLLISIYERHAVKKEVLSAVKETHYYESQFKLIEYYIKSHLCENITIYDISRYTGFSKSTIKRICSKSVGGGAINYAINLKMEEAKRLIEEADMNITQISEQLGFADVHYFSRIFKNRVGVSPKQYEKMVSDR